MKIAFMVTRALFGILGIAQLVLGVLFWFGLARPLIPLHMALGGAFVIVLWVLAVLCARAGAPMGLAATTIVWGALLPVLGMMQMRLMPGAAHWVIQVSHLLMAVIAMGLGGRLSVGARGMERGAAGTASRPAAPASRPQGA